MTFSLEFDGKLQLSGGRGGGWWGLGAGCTLLQDVAQLAYMARRIRLGRKFVYLIRRSLLGILLDEGLAVMVALVVVGLTLAGVQEGQLTLPIHAVEEGARVDGVGPSRLDGVTCSGADEVDGSAVLWRDNGWFGDWIQNWKRKKMQWPLFCMAAWGRSISTNQNPFRKEEQTGGKNNFDTGRSSMIDGER